MINTPTIMDIPIAIQRINCQQDRLNQLQISIIWIYPLFPPLNSDYHKILYLYSISSPEWIRQWPQGRLVVVLISTWWCLWRLMGWVRIDVLITYWCHLLSHLLQVEYFLLPIISASSAALYNTLTRGWKADLSSTLLLRYSFMIYWSIDAIT